MNEMKKSQHRLLAPLVLFEDDPNIVNSLGDRLCKNGRPESIGFRQSREQLKAPDTVFGVSAGAALISMEVFEKIGRPFDERFVAYFEDVDVCFRARLAGFSAGCVPDAVARHVGSASQDGKTWYRSRQCYRNHGLLVLKCMPSPLMAKYAPHLLREHVHQTSMMFSAARAEFGFLRAVGIMLRADLSLLLNIPHALAERFRIRTYRCVSAREIDRILES